MISKGIFKKFDIRGKYPKEVNEEVFFQIGKSFVEMIKAEEIIVGYDGRNSSQSLAKALCSGINAAGAKVVNIGLCSTPAFYYAVCYLKKKAGLMITASHLGKDFNGLKLVGENAVALREEEMKKLSVIARRVLPTVCHCEEVFPTRQSLDSDCHASSADFARNDKNKRNYNIKPDYISALQFFIKSPMQKMKVVIDCGGGAAALYVKNIFDNLENVEPVYLFNEIDGSFSGRGSNPKEEKSRKPIIQKINSEKADLGIMYDGDADRVYFLDNNSEVIDPNFVSAFIIEYLSEKGARGILSFIADIRSSKVIADTVQKVNGKLVISPAWHTEIKKAVKENNAIFGSETSGHYIFGDFYNIDDGILASLIFLQALGMNYESRIKNQELKSKKQTNYNCHCERSQQTERGNLEDMNPNGCNYRQKLQVFKSQYHILEETNFEINKKSAENILRNIEKKYQKTVEKIIKIDGLTMQFKNWRFNLRMSLSEPLLRLNMEADTEKLLQEKFEEISAVLV